MKFDLLSSASVIALGASILSINSAPANATLTCNIGLGTCTETVSPGKVQAELTMNDGTPQAVTTGVSWTSSSPLVASVSTAAPGGRGGAGAGAGGLATGIGAGTAVITATYSTFTATVTLTVTQSTPVSLTVTPPSPTLYVSQTQAFVATVVYSDNTTAVVTGSATWSSSDATVVVITATGGGGGAFPGGGGGGATATALGTGTATITATYGTLTGTATVTVTNPPLSYVQVTPTNPNIPAQATAQFTATAVYADNSTRNVTTSAPWSSSTSSVAAIANSGATIGRATGISAGTSTITATYQGMSGSSVLTVAQGISSIVVTPAVKTTVLGIPVTFTATAILSNNATFALGGAAKTITLGGPGMLCSSMCLRVFA